MYTCYMSIHAYARVMYIHVLVHVAIYIHCTCSIYMYMYVRIHMHSQCMEYHVLPAGFDMFEKEVEIDGERIKVYLWYVM